LHPDQDINYLLTVSDVFQSVARRFRLAQIDLWKSLLASIPLTLVLLAFWSTPIYSSVFSGALIWGAFSSHRQLLFDEKNSFHVGWFFSRRKLVFFFV
jgi:hypothetical protein